MQAKKLYPGAYVVGEGDCAIEILKFSVEKGDEFDGWGCYYRYSQIFGDRRHKTMRDAKAEAERAVEDTKRMFRGLERDGEARCKRVN